MPSSGGEYNKRLSRRPARKQQRRGLLLLSPVGIVVTGVVRCAKWQHSAGSYTAPDLRDARARARAYAEKKPATPSKHVVLSPRGRHPFSSPEIAETLGTTRLVVNQLLYVATERQDTQDRHRNAKR